MDTSELADLIRKNPSLGSLLEPRRTEYMSEKMSSKQIAFLLCDALDVLYGGSAGGGKTQSLLDAALQYVDMPGYAALIVRATFTDLAMPGAIMDRAKSRLLGKAGVKWDDKQKKFTFPSGARLQFGHLDGPSDHYNYQSSEFQFIGVDEVSQLRWNQVLYLFSRLRKTKNINAPLRFRCASNPGGRSHQEVFDRYINPETREDRIFIPAGLADNPFLDRVEYEKSLSNLDPVTRAQLLNGDWTIRNEGGIFLRGWFPIVASVPEEAKKKGKWVRFWDLAATVPKKDNTDPDWTVGCLCILYEGKVYIVDVVRARRSPDSVETLVKETAERDGRRTLIRMEQEPGSSGVNTINRYTKLLRKFAFCGFRSTGPKEEYARPLSAAAERGDVSIVSGRWIPVFLDELELFPFGAHDDQVDAVSKCYACLTGKKKRGGVW